MSERAGPSGLFAGIKYEERPPRPRLRPFIRCLWFYECLAAEPRVERIAGDGCPELVVHVLSPYREVAPDGEETDQPPALFAGQLAKPLTLRSAWPVAMLGVRFEPDGARDFFGAPMSGAADRRVDAEAMHGAPARRLLADVRAAADWDARLGLAEDYVEAALGERNAGIDPVVRGAVEALLRGVSLPAPALSERQVERRFKDRVGVSPRQLRTVLRFRRVFDAIERDAGGGWTASALAAGYFDQPQMARDFRRFLGCTAREWAREKIGLAAMLARPAPETYKQAAAAGAITGLQPEE